MLALFATNLIIYQFNLHWSLYAMASMLYIWDLTIDTYRFDMLTKKLIKAMKKQINKMPKFEIVNEEDVETQEEKDGNKFEAVTGLNRHKIN